MRKGGLLRASALWFALGCTTLTVLLPVRQAQADIRVWEDEEEDFDRYLELTAFIQPGYIWRLGDDPNIGVSDDTFWLHRARTGIRTHLLKWLKLRIEVEFAPVPRLQDAYVDMPFWDGKFSIKAGQQLVPFLQTFQFNELQLAFIDRMLYTPIAPDRSFLRFLSPRDIGLQLHGRLGDPRTTSRSFVFEYQLGAFLGRGANINRNDDNALLFAGRLTAFLFGLPKGVSVESDIYRNPTPKISTSVGVYTNCDDRANWNRGVNADAIFRYNGLYMSGSFVWFRNGPATGNGFGEALGYGDFCTGTVGDDDVPIEFISQGGHFQTQYVLPKVLFPLEGQSIELLGRIDWVDPNSPHGDQAPIPPPSYDDSDNAPTRWRVTLGLNWFPTSVQSLRLQLNYQFNRETEDVATPEGFIVGVQNDILWLQLTAGI